MPYSDPTLRPWIADRLAGRCIQSVVDVGAGAGDARDSYRFPGAKWTAIEIWPAYVLKFGLRDRYDTVIVTDVRELDPLPEADLYLFCDVLEHMPVTDAITLWERARKAASWLVISLPVLPYPQGPEEGNPHEEHVAQWDAPSVLEAFAGIFAYSGPRPDLTPGTTVGAFTARGLRA